MSVERFVGQKILNRHPFGFFLRKQSSLWLSTNFFFFSWFVFETRFYYVAQAAVTA